MTVCYAPVTITTFPVWSGTFSWAHSALGGKNSFATCSCALNDMAVREEMSASVNHERSIIAHRFLIILRKPLMIICSNLSLVTVSRFWVFDCTELTHASRDCFGCEDALTWGKNSLESFNETFWRQTTVLVVSWYLEEFWIRCANLLVMHTSKLELGYVHDRWDHLNLRKRLEFYLRSKVSTRIWLLVALDLLFKPSVQPFTKIQVIDGRGAFSHTRPRDQELRMILSFVYQQRDKISSRLHCILGHLLRCLPKEK